MEVTNFVIEDEEVGEAGGLGIFSPKRTPLSLEINFKGRQN